MRNNIGSAHYKQLLFYMERWAERGEYYGNKDQFLDRHEQIMRFLEEAISKIQSKKQKAD